MHIRKKLLTLLLAAALGAGAAGAAGAAENAAAAASGTEEAGASSIKAHWYQSSAGNWFWMQEDGTTLRDGCWHVLGGKRYFLANNSGRRKSGWITYCGKQYYLSKKTGILMTGFLQTGGRTYYLSKNGTVPGAMATGFFTLDGKRYFAQDDGKLVSGWRNVKGKKYYFLLNHTAVKGWQTIDKKKYYFDTKNYNLRKGWITDGGKSYYMDPSTGVMKTGWVSYGGNKYYLGSDGARVTGLQTIGGKQYMFSSSGVMVKNHTAYEYNGGYYTIDADGVVEPTTALRASVRKLTWDYINAHSNASQSNEARFRSCFNYLVAYMKYRPRAFNSAEFAYDGWQYQLTYNCLSQGAVGNCYNFACTVASIAKELGYDPTVIVTTGDHGFVIIGGRYYDNMGAQFGTYSHSSYTVYKQVKY